MFILHLVQCFETKSVILILLELILISILSILYRNISKFFPELKIILSHLLLKVELEHIFLGRRPAGPPFFLHKGPLFAQWSFGSTPIEVVNSF